MKKQIIAILILLSFNSYSQFVAGQPIKANSLNNSTFQIGDIKESILNEIKFKGLHGDCWVLMSGQNIATSDLGLYGEMSNLPNLTDNGEFLRQATSSVLVGTIQGDAIRNITGSHMDGIRSPIYNTTAGNSGAFVAGPYRVGPTASTASGSYAGYPLNFDASRVVPTANENRPKSISINMFVKINNECN
jgi:hypothetical protein